MRVLPDAADPARLFLCTRAPVPSAAEGKQNWLRVFPSCSCRSEVSAAARPVSCPSFLKGLKVPPEQPCTASCGLWRCALALFPASPVHAGRKRGGGFITPVLGHPWLDEGFSTSTSSQRDFSSIVVQWGDLPCKLSGCILSLELCP